MYTHTALQAEITLCDRQSHRLRGAMGLSVIIGRPILDKPYERQRARGSTPQVPPTIGHLQTPSAAAPWPPSQVAQLRAQTISGPQPALPPAQPQRVSGGPSPALPSRMSAAAATQQQQLRPFTHQQEQDLSEQNNGKRVSGNLLLLLLLLALHP